jgi:hypothetical protein
MEDAELKQHLLTIYKELREHLIVEDRLCTSLAALRVALFPDNKELERKFFEREDLLLAKTQASNLTRFDAVIQELQA